MASVLVAAATTLYGRGGGLAGIGDLDRALGSVAGPTAARLLLAAGVLGAALVAAIVVSLALAWAVAEGCGRPHSLDHSPRRAPLFYGIYVAAVAVGATLVLTSGSLVRLAVRVEILNALLLPLVLGFLVLLAFRVLPRPYAPRGRERIALAGTVAAVVAIGLFSAGLSFGL
jgi:Mn2+/Fe2+ NRAMP family transporter